MHIYKTCKILIMIKYPIGSAFYDEMNMTCKNHLKVTYMQSCNIEGGGLHVTCICQVCLTNLIGLSAHIGVSYIFLFLQMFALGSFICTLIALINRYKDGGTDDNSL